VVETPSTPIRSGHPGRGTDVLDAGPERQERGRGDQRSAGVAHASFGFDPAGDETSAPITIVRARGGGSPAVLTPEGAQVVRVIGGASESG
jgi:hypothetical protein